MWRTYANLSRSVHLDDDVGTLVEQAAELDDHGAPLVASERFMLNLEQQAEYGDALQV